MFTPRGHGELNYITSWPTLTFLLRRKAMWAGSWPIEQSVKRTELASFIDKGSGRVKMIYALTHDCQGTLRHRLHGGSHPHVHRYYRCYGVRGITALLVPRSESRSAIFSGARAWVRTAC